LGQILSEGSDIEGPALLASTPALLYENPMTKTTAQEVSEFLRAAAAKIDESVRVVQGSAPSELDEYRRSVGT